MKLVFLIQVVNCLFHMSKQYFIMNEYLQNQQGVNFYAAPYIRSEYNQYASLVQPYTIEKYRKYNNKNYKSRGKECACSCEKCYQPELCCVEMCSQCQVTPPMMMIVPPPPAVIVEMPGSDDSTETEIYVTTEQVRTTKKATVTKNKTKKTTTTKTTSTKTKTKKITTTKTTTAKTTTTKTTETEPPTTTELTTTTEEPSTTEEPVTTIEPTETPPHVVPRTKSTVPHYVKLSKTETGCAGGLANCFTINFGDRTTPVLTKFTPEFLVDTSICEDGECLENKNRRKCPDPNAFGCIPKSLFRRYFGGLKIRKTKPYPSIKPDDYLFGKTSPKYDMRRDFEAANDGTETKALLLVPESIIKQMQEDRDYRAYK